MDTVTQVQILDEAVCISLSMNTPWERYESIYSPYISIVRKTGYLTKALELKLEEGKLWIKLFKNWLCVISARAEGWVNKYNRFSYFKV